MKIGRFFDQTPGPSPAPARSRPAVPETTKSPAPTDPVPVEARTKLAMYEGEISQIRRLSGKPLKTLGEAHLLTELLSRAAVAVKELESCRKAAIEPYKAKVRTIDVAFKPLTLALEEVVTQGKRCLLAWNQQERARVEREQREAARLAEEAAQREGEALAEADAAATPEARQEALAKAEAASAEQAQATVAAPQPAPRVLKSDYGSAGIRKRWTFEVVQPQDVPRQYLTVDERAIRAAVLAGVREIPGVAITETEGIAVRVQ